MMVILDSHDSKSFQELRKLGNQKIPYILSLIRNAGDCDVKKGAVNGCKK